MSWNVFRKIVSAKLKPGNTDSDSVAETMANEYDRAVKSPVAGDLFYRNRVSSGNKSQLESFLKIGFKVSGITGRSSDFIRFATLGLQSYWMGAQLGKLKIPLIPAPGSTGNTSITLNLVLNSGKAAPLPLLGSTDSSQFVETFIKIAKLHLLTISGITQTISIYPPGVTGPGVLPWFGYFVLDIKGKIPNGFSEDKNSNGDIIVDDQTGERFTFDVNGNLAKVLSTDEIEALGLNVDVANGVFELIEERPNGTRSYIFRVKN